MSTPDLRNLEAPKPSQLGLRSRLHPTAQLGSIVSGIGSPVRQFRWWAVGLVFAGAVLSLAVNLWTLEARREARDLLDRARAGCITPAHGMVLDAPAFPAPRTLGSERRS